jgi:hypothetical protein
VRKYSGEMWYGNNPVQPEIALFDCVYNWLNDSVRKFNADDYFVCKLALDYAAWKEQPPAYLESELLAGDAGFFEDEPARERVCGRLALALIMCNGNFRKKALVFKGKGNNGKSGLMSRCKHMFEMVSAPGGDEYNWVTEATSEVRFFFFFWANRHPSMCRFFLLLAARST